MATLGQNSSNGDFFQISGTYNQVQAVTFTVPNPGIIITALHGWAQSNTGGGISNCRLYCWEDVSGANNYGSGNWLYRSNLFTLGTAKGQIDSSSVAANTGVLASDGYIAAGNNLNFGIYVPSFPYTVFGSGSGQSNIGDAGDGNFHFRAVAGSGFGQMEAWCDYTVLAAPTISGVSPSVAPPGSLITITGTGFLHASGVTIGGVAVGFTVVSDTTITATVPSSGVGGVVSVVVTTPAGSASATITAGQIYWGNAGAVSPIVAVWYGDPSGNGTPHKAAGVWVPDGAGGVKRVW